MERTFISGFVSAPRTSDMRTLRSRGLRVSMEIFRLVDESYISPGCARTAVPRMVQVNIAAWPHPVPSYALRIDPRRLMSKLLHVLNIRPRINSGIAVRAAFAPQFQHT